MLYLGYNSYTPEENQMNTLSIPLKKGAVIDLSHLPYGSRFVIKKITKDYVLLRVKKRLLVRKFKGLDNSSVFDDKAVPFIERFRSKWSSNPFRRGFYLIVVTSQTVFYGPVTMDGEGITYSLRLG